MDFLRDGLTHSELQHWGNSLKSAQDIWGVTELSSFRVRAGRAPFFQTEVLAEGTVSLLSPPLSSLKMQAASIAETPVM